VEGGDLSDVREVASEFFPSALGAVCKKPGAFWLCRVEVGVAKGAKIRVRVVVVSEKTEICEGKRDSVCFVLG